MPAFVAPPIPLVARPGAEHCRLRNLLANAELAGLETDASRCYDAAAVTGALSRHIFISFSGTGLLFGCF